MHADLQNNSLNRSSIASFDNSRGSQVSIARTSDPGLQNSGQRAPVNFEIGNMKDWAPTEIASRSEVY